jgi:hypothetical protein
MHTKLCDAKFVVDEEGTRVEAILPIERFKHDH